MNNFLLQCYDFDKFEGYPSEEEAVVRGINLLDQTQLWAVIIFDSSDSNSTLGSEDELPNHITYKIRYDMDMMMNLFTWILLKL